MAIAIVHKKQTGSAAATFLTITAAAKGNLLVVFGVQLGTTAISPSDNISLTVGWTVHATHAVDGGSANSVYVAYKVAVGGETEIQMGSAGTAEGLSYFELSGASTTVDTIVHTDNQAAGLLVTSPAVTTTNAGSIVLGCVGDGAAAFGIPEAWTGTGPMTNVETINTRSLAGSYLPGTTLSGATFTAHWPTSRVSGILVVAFAPGSVTQTLAASLSFQGALPRASSVQLPATVSFTGGVSRLVSRAIAATVSFTASVPRAASRALAATLSFTGALRRAVATTQHATLSFAGGLPRLVARKLTAALTFAGALLPAETGHFVQHLTAALSFQGALPRATSRALQATATFTGGLQRASARALHATLTFAGSVPRATARTLHATLTFTGVLGRGILRGLRAGLTWAGQLLPGGKVEPGAVSLLNAPRSSVLLTDQALGTVALSAAPATRALLSDALVDPG